MNGGSQALMASKGHGTGFDSTEGVILNIGYGGGGSTRCLLHRCEQAKVAGVDYSPVSVEKSSKVNANAIDKDGARCLPPMPQLFHSKITPMT